MLGAIGLVRRRSIPGRSRISPGMMNFVIFPMFFLSSALYPLWKLREAGAQAIYWLRAGNPFTHAVELIRFAAYGQFNAGLLCRGRRGGAGGLCAGGAGL